MTAPTTSTAWGQVVIPLTEYISMSLTDLPLAGPTRQFIVVPGSPLVTLVGRSWQVSLQITGRQLKKIFSMQYSLGYSLDPVPQ